MCCSNVGAGSIYNKRLGPTRGKGACGRELGPSVCVCSDVEEDLLSACCNKSGIAANRHSDYINSTPFQAVGLKLCSFLPKSPGHCCLSREWCWAILCLSFCQGATPLKHPQGLIPSYTEALFAALACGNDPLRILLAKGPPQLV